MKRYEIENLLNMTLDEAYKKNEKLVYFVINKYYAAYKKSHWQEDIIQCGNIGLWNGINTIDPAKVYNQSSITQHLIFAIRTEINYLTNHTFGYNGTKKREETFKITSYNKTITEDNCEMINILSDSNLIGNGNKSESDIVNSIDLYNAIKKLESVQKKVILLILQGLNQKEIADTLGITESRACRLKQKAFNILKNELMEVC